MPLVVERNHTKKTSACFTRKLRGRRPVLLLRRWAVDEAPQKHAKSEEGGR